MHGLGIGLQAPIPSEIINLNSPIPIPSIEHHQRMLLRSYACPQQPIPVSALEKTKNRQLLYSQGACFLRDWINQDKSKFKFTLIQLAATLLTVAGVPVAMVLWQTLASVVWPASGTEVAGRGAGGKRVQGNVTVTTGHVRITETLPRVAQADG